MSTPERARSALAALRKAVRKASANGAVHGEIRSAVEDGLARDGAKLRWRNKTPSVQCVGHAPHHCAGIVTHRETVYPGGGVGPAFYYYCNACWTAPAMNGGPSAAERTGVS